MWLWVRILVWLGTMGRNGKMLQIVSGSHKQWARLLICSTNWCLASAQFLGLDKACSSRGRILLPNGIQEGRGFNSRIWWGNKIHEEPPLLLHYQWRYSSRFRRRRLFILQSEILLHLLVEFMDHSLVRTGVELIDGLKWKKRIRKKDMNPLTSSW